MLQCVGSVFRIYFSFTAIFFSLKDKEQTQEAKLPGKLKNVLPCKA